MPVLAMDGGRRVVDVLSPIDIYLHQVRLVTQTPLYPRLDLKLVRSSVQGSSRRIATMRRDDALTCCQHTGKCPVYGWAIPAAVKLPDSNSLLC